MLEINRPLWGANLFPSSLNITLSREGSLSVCVCVCVHSRTRVVCVCVWVCMHTHTLVVSLQYKRVFQVYAVSAFVHVCKLFYGCAYVCSAESRVGKNPNCEDNSTDNEVQNRINQASAAYGGLGRRVFQNENRYLNTKICVY